MVTAADIVESCEWRATHNLQPPGPARLTVSCTCKMPTPGYVLTLARAKQQPADFSQLTLDLSVQEPKGMVPQVITATQGHYAETTTLRIRSILVRPGDITIAVQEVQ